MVKAQSFETITDATKSAELIHKYIRRQRVEFPDDLADLISEIAAELLCSVDACHSADFLLREKNDKKEASILMDEVMMAITTFKNQFGFLISQADYCLHGVNGTRLSNEKYTHKPNNRLPLLPVSMIAQGLNGIKADFRDWRVERRTNGWVLVVETHPVKIADPRYDVVVNFGPFNIELILSQLARGVSKPYIITALEPNLSENHTHPHIRTNVLCEGTGESMIRKALQVGDIQSFLIIVSQILSTYNPASPYLRLEHWSKNLPRGPHPRPHADFGIDESSDSICPICEDEVGDPYNCTLCGDTVCEECNSYCSTHETTICGRCRDRLRSSDGVGCPNCSDLGISGCVIGVRQVCQDCGVRLPSTELMYCSARARYMCRNCYNSRAREQRACCPGWTTTPTCMLLSRLSHAPEGTAEDIRPIQDSDADRPEPVRREGFIDTAPDDGVGGFAPAVNTRTDNGTFRITAGTESITF